MDRPPPVETILATNAKVNYRIYAVRTAVTGYYNLRVDSISKRLKEQQTERNSTIQKLKAATKYDSTMELIEKYGGEGRIKKGEGDDGEQAAGKGRGKPGSKDANRTMPERTQFAPPATANIQRRPLPNANDPRRQQAHRMEPSAEFAPNAGLVSPASPPTSQQLRSTSNDNTISRQHTLSRQHSALSVTSPETHWYDRIFDVLLGEDETAAKNRIILLCGSCRLVNGQAPPGTKSLVEVGMWRCMRCGASNGEESETEGQRIVKEVLSGKGLAEETSRQTDLGHRNGASQSESDDELHEGSDSSDVNPVEGNGEAVAAVGEDAAAGVKRRRPRNP